MEEPITLDARATRFDDGIVAVLLMVAFVFDIDWLVPVAAVDAALGAAFGRAGAPFVRSFEEYLAPHLAEPHRFVDVKVWRVAQAMTAAAVLVGALLVFGPAASVGWLLVIAIAMVAALDAVAGISIPRWVYRRWLTRS